MTRIITLTGAQGVGKTTLASAVSSRLKERGATVIDQYAGVVGSISREARDKGFTINENTNFETQYYIACRYMLADIETRKKAELTNTDYIILDRSVLDVIPYVMGSPNIKTVRKEYIASLVGNHYKYYPTELVYVEPLGIIVPDSHRSTNPEFQDVIIRQFSNMLEHTRHKTIGNMSVDDRVAVLLKMIDEK